jgi:hypothetical protein
VEAYSQTLSVRPKQACYENSVMNKASTLSSSKNNYPYKFNFAHSATNIVICTCDILTLASISTTRSPDYIVHFSVSRHMTGTAESFFSILV